MKTATSDKILEAIKEGEAIAAKYKEAVDEFNEKAKLNPCPECGVNSRIDGNRLFVCRHQLASLKFASTPGQNARLNSISGLDVHIVDH